MALMANNTQHSLPADALMYLFACTRQPCRGCDGVVPKLRNNCHQNVQCKIVGPFYQ